MGYLDCFGVERTEVFDIVEIPDYEYMFSDLLTLQKRKKKGESTWEDCQHAINAIECGAVHIWKRPHISNEELLLLSELLKYKDNQCKKAAPTIAQYIEVMKIMGDDIRRIEYLQKRNTEEANAEDARELMLMMIGGDGR